MKLLPASLTLRLSLAFAGLAVAVFSALGCTWGERRMSMLELDRHELLGKLELARHAAAGAASAEALRAGLVESLVGHHGLWVAIDGGRPGRSSVGRMRLPPAPSRGGGRGGRGARSGRCSWADAARGGRERRYWLGETARVVVARDIAHHTRFLDDMRRDFWLAVPQRRS